VVIGSARTAGVDKTLNVEYYINMSKPFSEKLRELRRAAAISQRKLAELADVDFSYISKLENARLPAPAASTILRLAEILGCPAEDLLSAGQKMPGEVESQIAGQPEAQHFLREASELELTPSEWEQMRGALRNLRTESRKRNRR
jgi:transcriptional regulator with XRE-family HTH domain